MALRKTLLSLAIFASAINCSVAAAQRSYSQCQSDPDCPVGYYCFQRGAHSICDPCIDCVDRYSRSPSPRKACARSSYECGGCIDGFREEARAGGGTKDKCVPSQPQFPTTNVDLKDGGDEEAAGVNMWYIVLGVMISVLVVGIVAVVGFMVCGEYRDRKARSSTNEADAESNHDAATDASEDRPILQPSEHRGDAPSPPIPLPPTYDEAIDAQRHLEAVMTPREDDNEVAAPDPASVPVLSEPRCHSLEHVQEKERLQSAEPFNVDGYRRHQRRPTAPPTPDDDGDGDGGDQAPGVVEGALDFDGRFELSLEIGADDGGDNRPASPADSTSTEPSQWEPGQFRMHESDLSRIQEEVPEEEGEEEEDREREDGLNDVNDDGDAQMRNSASVDAQAERAAATGGGNGEDLAEGEDGDDEDDDSASLRRDESRRASTRFSGDSGLPHTASPSVTSLESDAAPLSLAAGQRGSGDSMLSLDHQDTVRSLDQVVGSTSGRPALVRTFSNVDLQHNSCDDSARKATKRKGEGRAEEEAVEMRRLKTNAN